MSSHAEILRLAEQALRAGDLPRAEALYRRLLSELHGTLAVVRWSQGKLAPATESFRQAVALEPDSPEANNNLGHALWMRGELDEALGPLSHALKVSPHFPEALNNLGMAYLRKGSVALAIRCFQESLRLNPNSGLVHENLLMALNYSPSADPGDVLAEHRRWASRHEANAPRFPTAVDPDPDRRLRIGYVSPNFSQHMVASFVEPILAHHDLSQVEVIAYAEEVVRDATTERLRSMTHGWRATNGLTDHQVAKCVWDDRVDILVDLAGHTGYNRLGAFAYKPAPIQVTYLGYPNTTGLSTIDYRLTDAVADPPGEPAWYSETLYRLPGCFCCYRPWPDAPPVSPLPAARNGYVTFGSLHDLAKLNEGVFDLWRSVLINAPGSRMLVFRHTLRGQTVDDVKRWIAGESWGIAEDRVEFRHEPGERGFLGVYDDVDILLDCLPWSGHVTTCEALWQGVPVLTLRGDRHAGRLSTTVLATLGMNDWIADTAERFRLAAFRRANDKATLMELRSSLRERIRLSPLCDAASFTQKLEAAFRDMWRTWCAAPRS